MIMNITTTLKFLRGIRTLLADLWQVWEIKKLNIVRIDKPILTINDD